MSIQDKIDEIRKKPEHIRLRYVWALTAVSAFFIIIIWIFAFSAQGKKESDRQVPTQQILDDLGKQSKSIKDAASNLKGAFDSQSGAQNQTPEPSDNQ